MASGSRVVIEPSGEMGRIGWCSAPEATPLAQTTIKLYPAGSSNRSPCGKFIQYPDGTSSLWTNQPEPVLAGWIAEFEAKCAEDTAQWQHKPRIERYYPYRVLERWDSTKQAYAPAQ